MKKKIGVLIVLLILLGFVMQSCRGTKPPCPAYTKVENVQKTSTQNFAR